MKIAITGGKGGTGKSTVATALSVEMARKIPTMILDCDVEGPNDHILLSIHRKKMKDVEAVLPDMDHEKCQKCGTCAKICTQSAIVFVKGRYPILIPDQCNGCGTCILACPYKAITSGEKVIGTLYEGHLNKNAVDAEISKNFLLLSGEVEPGCESTSAVVRATREYAEKLYSKYDLMIVDTPAGTHCNVISSMQDLDMAFAVAEPTPLGKHDLELILDLLKVMEIEAKIIVNKSSIGDIKLIKNVSKEYGVEIVGKIPYEEGILKNYSKGIPVFHDSISSIASYIGEII